MKKQSNIVENYFQNVIKKSWTWEKLTNEERQRFIDMNVFDKIKGNDNTRIEWLNTIYQSFSWLHWILNLLDGEKRKKIFRNFSITTVKIMISIEKMKG